MKNVGVFGKVLFTLFIMLIPSIVIINYVSYFNTSIDLRDTAFTFTSFTNMIKDIGNGNRTGNSDFLSVGYLMNWSTNTLNVLSINFFKVYGSMSSDDIFSQVFLAVVGISTLQTLLILFIYPIQFLLVILVWVIAIALWVFNALGVLSQAFMGAYNLPVPHWTDYYENIPCSEWIPITYVPPLY